MNLPNKELLFYYESRQNPNGDPGFENQPRLMPDDTILVTDVRLKRTVRDYARDTKDQSIFVDYDAKGNAVTADQKAAEILGTKDLKKKDVMLELIEKTFDVPLFGALVTVRSVEKGEGDSYKLTGPVQFGMARSVNKVKVINPMIVGRFVGKEKGKAGADGGKQREHSTFGRFYAVEYALIKAFGAVTPRNLGKYAEDPKAIEAFRRTEEMLFDCLWDGTNFLVTRSKYPQRSVFFIEVAYDSAFLYNDLASLVDESEQMKGWATSLSASPFGFTRLIETLCDRKDKIKGIRIAHCTDIVDDVHKLKDQLKSKGLKVEDATCQE